MYGLFSGARLVFSTCSMSNASIQSAGAWVTASCLGAASIEGNDGRLGRHQVREVGTSWAKSARGSGVAVAAYVGLVEEEEIE